MGEPTGPKDRCKEETLARSIESKLGNWLTSTDSLTNDYLREDLGNIPEVGDVLAVLIPPDKESTVVLFFEYLPNLYKHPVNTVERVAGIPKDKILLNFYAQYRHNIPNMPVILDREGFYISCVSTDLNVSRFDEFPPELLANNIASLHKIARENIERKTNPPEVKRGGSLTSYPI